MRVLKLSRFALFGGNSRNCISKWANRELLLPGALMRHACSVVLVGAVPILIEGQPLSLGANQPSIVGSVPSMAFIRPALEKLHDDILLAAEMASSIEAAFLTA